MRDAAILMQNQNLQQSFIETNAQTNNVIHIHSTKNGHVINSSVDALKDIYNIIYNNNSELC